MQRSKCYQIKIAKLPQFGEVILVHLSKDHHPQKHAMQTTQDSTSPTCTILSFIH